MSKLSTLLVATAAVLSATVAQAQQYGQPNYQQPYGQAQQAGPSGNPLNSIFQCQNAGNRQGQGAVVGGLIGGLAGNQLAGDDDETLGTILGAALGAGIGSYVGCRMGQGDQQRATSALNNALAQGRSQTWSNPQSGASGRIDIVDTYNWGYAPGQQQQYGGQQYAPAPTWNLSNVRWVQGVEQPRQGEYQPSEGQYSANGTVNVRSGPSARARVVSTLRNGETFDGLVRVEGTDWVLASRQGQVLGYVSETNLRFLGETRQPAYAPPPPVAYDPRRGNTCRVFDQTYSARGARPEVIRNTACQTANGEWVVTA